MKKFYTTCIRLVFAFLSFFVMNANAQTTVTTPYTGSFTSFAAVANIAFVVENTNANDITLTGVSQYCQTTENGSIWELYYSATSLSGVGTPVPGASWTLVATSSAITVGANGIVPVFTNLSFNIPAGTQYRFVMKNTNVGSTRYILTPTPNVNVISGGGVNIKTGNNQIAGSNVGYSGQTTALGTTPRYWHGAITFVPVAPCQSPPTPGQATSSVSTAICTGTPVSLGLTGHTFGIGQTYVWQSSTDAAPPHTWTNISSSSSNSALSVSPSTTTFYRAALTCGANTVYSDSVKVLVNPALPAGTYTINNGVPTGGGNYQTFGEAITAMNCGIAGPVNFWVEPGSGPYTEQITIPSIGGASAVNNIRFIGNGATVQFTPVTGARHIIKLDGADYITLDSLRIFTSATDFGWGIQLMNGANYDSIRACTIDLTANTSTGVDNSAGIVMSNSATDANADGDASNNKIINNVIRGGYYGIIINGAASLTTAVSNKISGNTIQDFYSIGIELADADATLITYNDINRINRSWGTGATIVGAFEGIEMNGATKNTHIEGNRIHDTHTSAGSGDQGDASYAIFNSSNDAAVGSENKVINNVIYNFNSATGIQYALYNTGSDGVFYYHNTVVLDNTGSTSGVTRGFYQTTAATGIQFRNNIVYISRGGTSDKHAVYFATAGSAIVSNNNVLYNIGTGGTVTAIGYHNATSYNDIAAWKTANSNAYDQQSISEDPQFVGGGDFTPSNPNLNGMGANLGITTDIIGTSRGTSPDPGAYEFTVSGINAALSWVAPVNPPSTGLQTVTVSVTNASASGNITSVNLSYTDGVTLQTENYTGLNIAPSASQNLSFTTQYNITGNVTLRAYVNTVNGTPDIAQANDTATYNICFPMSGNYTINQGALTGGTNFASFGEAMQALGCGGVSGPVVFNVVAGSGPYTGRIIIPAFAGGSVTNTVTIQGNGETLSHAASDGGSRSAVWFNGADHVILDSLVIDVSGGTFGWGIALTNQADSNTITKCSITTVANSTSANYAGIVINGSSAGTAASGNNGNGNTISNNTITGGYYGMYLYGNSASNTQNVGNKIIGNTIKDAYLYTIYVIYHADFTISKNDISRPTRAIATATTTTYGLYITTGVLGSLVEKNRIHDMFTAMPAHTGTFYAVYHAADGTAAQPNRIENNLIYNLGANGTVYGIYNTTSPYMHAYHNTIVHNDQVATTGTAFGFYQTGTSAGVEFKNNIVYIARSGTGQKRAVHFATTTSTIASNYNVLYLSPALAGTDNNVGTYGSTAYLTLADWKTANANAYDQNSVAEDPMFTNAAGGDFKPTNSAIDNIFPAIAGITTDILDAARGSNVDPGAYSFSVPDIIPPFITYTPLINVATTANRTLTATITDPSGVHQGTNGPRLYYKKSTDVAYVFDASPVKSGNDYTFTIDHSLLTGVTNGTRIEYYVAAQDSVGNGGTNPSGGSGINPPGTTAPGTPNSYKIATLLSGIYTVGSGDNYINLTAIANELNTLESAIGGNVVFELTNNYDGTTGETLPINFNQYITTDPNWTVTIRPATGVTGRVTSGDPGSGVGVAVINLNGVDKLIFDGRPGGTGTDNEWTFRNTRTATTIGAVFRFVDDATYNTIRNLNLESRATSTTTGVVFLNTSTGTLGNSNNTITANHIRAISGATISVGIYSSGTATALNTDNLISNNRIYNFDDNGINIAATGNGANWTITGNHLYNATISPSTQTGILIASATSTNVSITNNFIGGNDENAVGLWSNSGNVTVSGISCSNGLATISGNTIMNIAGTGTGTAARIQGISQTSVLGTFTISNNTIRNLSTNGTSSGIAFGNQSARGIYIGPSGQFVGTTITGNIIDNISVESTSALATSNIVAGIAAYNLQNTVVANNVITNIKNKTTGIAANAYPLAVGLFTSYWSGGTAANNMISIGENESTNTQFAGILQIGPGGSNTHNYYNNTILVSGNSGGTISSYGFVRGLDSSTVQNQVTNFRNNIVSMQRTSGGGNNYAIANRGTAAAGGWTSNYNDLYSLDIASVGLWNATGYDFAAWKTASSGDANSVSVQPFFVSESDLHLVTDANCELHDKGIPIAGLTTDIDGNTRNVTTPDIGADEFTGNFNLTVTNPSAVCEGVTVNLAAAAVTTGSSTGGTFSYWTNAGATTPLAGPTAVSASGTYYIKLSKGTCADVKPVTVTINPPASNAAGATATTECGSATIAGTTQFTYTDCDLIAKIAPAAGSPVNGSVNACVTIDASVQTTTGGEAYVQRHYDITPAVNPSTATSTVTLYFLQTEFNAFNAANGTFPDLPVNSSDAAGIANLRVTQYNGTGTAPGNYSGTATQIDPVDAGIVWNSTANRWEVTFSVTGSGGFYVHTGGFVLPVTGVELKGQQSGVVNKLTWETLTEINNKGFEVQRSTDGINFSTIAFVATKATNGNSTSALIYSYDDAKPFDGNNYYRLKQVDKDGRTTFSNMVLLTRKVSEVTISSLYPNPTRHELNLVISSPKTEKLTIVVTDLSGKIAMQLSIQVVNGENRQLLNVHSLAAGTYVIKALCANGCETAAQRFVKQ